MNSKEEIILVSQDSGSHPFLAVSLRIPGPDESSSPYWNLPLIAVLPATALPNGNLLAEKTCFDMTSLDKGLNSLEQSR